MRIGSYVCSYMCIYYTKWLKYNYTVAIGFVKFKVVLNNTVAIAFKVVQYDNYV